MTTKVRLKCSLCGGKFFKSLGEVRYQEKKWVARGKHLPKPFFCSRDCGQSYSGRTYASNFDSIYVKAKGLRTREAHKYAKLQKWLIRNRVKHQFEYPLGKFVFDLALKFDGRKVLVEFDGNYHVALDQSKIDQKKQKRAESAGWEVHRVHQPKANKIPTRYVKQLVQF